MRRCPRDADPEAWADARAEWADHQHDLQHSEPMALTKHYLNNLICACAPEERFPQDAIEHALVTGFVSLTGHPTHDVVIIMRNYDAIITNYRQAQAASNPLLEATLNFAAAAGLPVTEVADHFQRAA